MRTSSYLLKRKITIDELFSNKLDELYSEAFELSEREKYSDLAKFPSIAEILNFNHYLLEKRKIVFMFFRMAIVRSISFEMLGAYHTGSSTLSTNEKYKSLETRAYSQCLSNAEDAGIPTFVWISLLFIAELGLDESNDFNENSLEQTMLLFENEFMNLYKLFERYVKKYTIVQPSI